MVSICTCSCFYGKTVGNRCLRPRRGGPLTRVSSTYLRGPSKPRRKWKLALLWVAYSWEISRAIAIKSFLLPLTLWQSKFSLGPLRDPSLLWTAKDAGQSRVVPAAENWSFAGISNTSLTRRWFFNQEVISSILQEERTPDHSNHRDCGFLRFQS